MKCPRQTSMPSGIQLWLEEQLEARGIDAAVYSNYILSVLCNESSGLPIKPKDCGVKILIDELRAKLKGIQEKGQFPHSNLAPSKNLEEDKPQSFQEKAFRYYTAFPPLTSKAKPDQICTSVGSLSSVWSGKRVFGSSFGKNRTFSEGNNRDSKFNNIINWLEENKENNGYKRDVKEKMRSRSTVKQQIPEKFFRNMAKSLDRNDDFNGKSEMSKSRRLYQQSKELASECIQALWAPEKSFDDLTGCDQDLPMDFQQLLESPEATKTSLDFSRCIGTKQPSSFIQCGTNITSSIWSEKAEDAMDCSMIGDTSNDLNLSLNFNKSAWGVPSEVAVNRPEKRGQESSGCLNPGIWSTGENNVFCDDSWKAVGNIDSKEPPDKYGKWSDVESTSLLLNDADNYFSSIGSNFQSSLTTLNHNKKDSSFIEVIPKVPSSGFSITKDILNAETAVNHNESTTSKKEDEKEEDLLTSMSTHFRPIKQEKREATPSGTGPIFPDGTTFPISNKLDELNFHKSPGGGLYLDSDFNKKYMEFNDAEDDTPSEFVPKFRVRQNEKFCQTEEIVLPPQNYFETDGEELFFPEDEKLVRSMVEEDDAEEEEENSFLGGDTCIKVDGWMATWPTSGIWSNEPNVQQIWCGGNVWNTATESVEGEKSEVSGGGDQYTQLRNEWTQEAEELLSDISQHLYLANYMDTTPPKLVEVEPKSNEPTVVVRGVSRDRKRRHWSSQLGANCQPPLSQGPSRSRPLTL